MNANDLFKAVMEINLDPIKTKLMHVESGEGWSLEKATAVEKEYRRFLCLMKLFPDEDTAPLVDVDTFWHYHILDTMKYAADCEQVFGYFLHHYPYVGMGGSEDDEQFRLDSGDRMRDLYESIFGEAYPGAPGAGARTAQAVATGVDQHVDGATAWCAGPRTETAWCAGPRTETTAWCAGPRIRAAAKAGEAAVGGATAWCAGPRAETTAWCAGPRIRAAAKAGEAAVSGATAWCAGPRTETAWCAGPRKAAASHEARPRN